MHWSVQCGKTADHIQMPFGIIGRTGPGNRQSVQRGTFGGKFGARRCNHWDLLSQQRDPLPKLLWADLLLLSILILLLDYDCWCPGQLCDLFDSKIKVWDLAAALDPRSPTSTLCLRTLVVSISEHCVGLTP